MIFFNYINPAQATLNIIIIFKSSKDLGVREVVI